MADSRVCHPRMAHTSRQAVKPCGISVCTMHRDRGSNDNLDPGDEAHRVTRGVTCVQLLTVRGVPTGGLHEGSLDSENDNDTDTTSMQLLTVGGTHRGTS